MVHQVWFPPYRPRRAVLERRTAEEDPPGLSLRQPQRRSPQPRHSSRRMSASAVEACRKSISTVGWCRIVHIHTALICGIAGFVKVHWTNPGPYTPTGAFSLHRADLLARPSPAPKDDPPRAAIPNAFRTRSSRRRRGPHHRVGDLGGVLRSELGRFEAPAGAQ